MINWLKKKLSGVWKEEVTPLEELARECYRDIFPDKECWGSYLQAEETTRYVVCVLEPFRPPKGHYFGIDKETNKVYHITADGRYQSDSVR